MHASKGSHRTGALTSDDRQAIGRACVQALLATPAGEHIDPWRLHDLVDEHVVRGCVGRSVDFAPVLRELLSMAEVTEETLYVGLLNLTDCLEDLGVRVKMPSLSLSERSRQRILEAARAATHSAKSAYELRRLNAAVHRVERVRIGDLLVVGRHITQDQLDRALEAQKLYGRRLGTNLVEMGAISGAALARFLGRQLGLPCLTTIRNVEPEVLATIPKDMARRLRVFPVAIDDSDHALHLAMEDPLDADAIRDVERITCRSVRPYVAPETVIVYAMSRYYGHTQPTRLRAKADSG